MSGDARWRCDPGDEADTEEPIGALLREGESHLLEWDQSDTYTGPGHDGPCVACGGDRLPEARLKLCARCFAAGEPVEPQRPRVEPAELGLEPFTMRPLLEREA